MAEYRAGKIATGRLPRVISLAVATAALALTAAGPPAKPIEAHEIGARASTDQWQASRLRSARQRLRFGHMVQALIGLAALAILVAMSIRANNRFRETERLPMQWSLRGTVNWTAPRPLALAFIPILASLVLIASIGSTLLFGPRPGQEGAEVPVVCLLAASFIAVHALHIRLIGLTLDRKGR